MSCGGPPGIMRVVSGVDTLPGESDVEKDAMRTPCPCGYESGRQLREEVLVLIEYNNGTK